MMKVDMNLLRELNLWSIAFRVIFAMLVGWILGLERGIKDRPAGARTYTLVTLGSMLVMLTNIYMANHYTIGDPSRLGSQVVSGIGFLGAGTIITTSHNQVKGLTTAAGLWVSAALGLAIGVGFYEGAVIGAFAVLMIMTAFSRVKDRIEMQTRVVDLFVIFDDFDAFDAFLAICTENEWIVQDISNIQSDFAEDQRVMAYIALKLGSNDTLDTITELVYHQVAIKYIGQVE